MRPEVTAEDLERLRADEVVPDGRARCDTCGCLFDPTTGLIAERGDIRRVIEPATHLLPKA